jgi:integrase/recombinase XerD
VKNEIDNQIVHAQAPEGPIAGYIVSFAKSLSEQGCTRRSIYQQVLLAARFSRWLKQKGVARRRVTPDHPLCYLRYRARQLRPYRGDAAALKHLLDFLRSKSAIPARKISLRAMTPAERYTQALIEIRTCAPG